MRGKTVLVGSDYDRAGPRRGSFTRGVSLLNRSSQIAKRYCFFFAAASAYLRWKRSTRPAVSISFCLPVKNGWQLEQISTRINSPLCVERVSNVLPQAQCTFTAWYSGCIPSFISSLLVFLRAFRAGSTRLSETVLLPCLP